jgi:DNA-binding MarR family transcriptional regulator
LLDKLDWFEGPGRADSLSRQRISSKPIAELLEQISLLIYSSSVARKLKPSQWAALRFFDQAAKNVRTVSGFAEMNFTTNGSSSQTVTTLVSKKYLERIPDKVDGRRHSLQVTKSGKKLLANDPISVLSGTIDALPASQKVHLANIVTRLYRDVYGSQRGAN